MPLQWILLDIDNCLYNGLNPDGSFTEYKQSMRNADEAWAVILTKDLAGLRSYRQKRAEEVGMDKSLLEFLFIKTGKEYGIDQLATHRNGPNGYKPEQFLKSDPELVACLGNLQNAGYKIAALTDNPAGKRVLTVLGLLPKIIKEEFVFDSTRMGMLKNKEFYKNVLEILAAQANEAIMFGDSLSSDIIPAEAVGIKGQYAKNRDELMQHLCALLK
ncbi:MAG: HAD family hydrolase [Candidatus Magasanikbacteria bacterium]|nr:HAD family hydrolase [Candidatus Magasanikbacteria bacterium]